MYFFWSECFLCWELPWVFPLSSVACLGFLGQCSLNEAVLAVFCGWNGVDFLFLFVIDWCWWSPEQATVAGLFDSNYKLFWATITHHSGIRNALVKHEPLFHPFFVHLVKWRKRGQLVTVVEWGSVCGCCELVSALHWMDALIPYVKIVCKIKVQTHQLAFVIKLLMLMNPFSVLFLEISVPSLGISVLGFCFFISHREGGTKGGSLLLLLSCLRMFV